MRMVAPRTRLSAAGLLYLFGHDVAPRDPTAVEKTQIPCLGAQIPTRPLALQLVAATLWDLQERGVVLVQLVGARLATRDVLVSRSADLQLDGRVETGLTAGLGPEPESVRDVVRGWVGSGPGTAAQVVAAAHRDVVDAGLYDKAGPRCRAIEEQRDTFDALLNGWLAYRREERETYDLLHAECRVVLAR